MVREILEDILNIKIYSFALRECMGRLWRKWKAKMQIEIHEFWQMASLFLGTSFSVKNTKSGLKKHNGLWFCYITPNDQGSKWKRVWLFIYNIHPQAESEKMEEKEHGHVAIISITMRRNNNVSIEGGNLTRISPIFFWSIWLRSTNPTMHCIFSVKCQFPWQHSNLNK